MGIPHIILWEKLEKSQLIELNLKITNFYLMLRYLVEFRFIFLLGIETPPTVNI